MPSKGVLLVKSPPSPLHLDYNGQAEPMKYDENKIDEMVLALLYLTLHGGDRAWKGHDWDTLDRLHAKGYITNPATSAKSVVLTDEGMQLSKQLFEKHFVTGLD